MQSNIPATLYIWGNHYARERDPSPHLMINRLPLALYEIQPKRPESMHDICMSFCSRATRNPIAAPQFRKIRAQRYKLRGTSFARTTAMIVSAHQTDHQWPGELARLSFARSQTIHISEGASTLWQMIT